MQFARWSSIVSKRNGARRAKPSELRTLRARSRSSGLAAVGGLSRDATKRGGMPAGLRARARPPLCGKTRKRAHHAGTRRAIDGGCRGVPFASRGGETRARSGGRTFGRNWLKPRMRSLCPLKIVLTRLMTPSVSILFRRGERGRRSAEGTQRGPPVIWRTGSGAVRAAARAARRRSRRIDSHPSAVARDQKGRKAHSDRSRTSEL